MPGCCCRSRLGLGAAGGIGGAPARGVAAEPGGGSCCRACAGEEGGRAAARCCECAGGLANGCGWIGSSAMEVRLGCCVCDVGGCVR